MFGLGWGEVVVIGIVALIAIGPKELPTVLRSLGQWMGKIRRMANEFQGQFQEALREAELTDLKKQAEDLTSNISNFDPMARVIKPITWIPFKPADAPVSSAIPTTPLPAIDVPMPDLPPPVTENDFAPAEPAPAQEALKETKKLAGGSA